MEGGRIDFPSEPREREGRPARERKEARGPPEGKEKGKAWAENGPRKEGDFICFLFILIDEMNSVLL